jgi:lysophospholipase L1-like esterase
VPIVDPAAENWTDPAEPGVWADPIHPNDRGHAQIADRLAPLLRPPPLPEPVEGHRLP